MTLVIPHHYCLPLSLGYKLSMVCWRIQWPSCHHQRVQNQTPVFTNTQNCQQCRLAICAYRCMAYLSTMIYSPLFGLSLSSDEKCCVTSLFIAPFWAELLQTDWLSDWKLLQTKLAAYLKFNSNPWRLQLALAALACQSVLTLNKQSNIKLTHLPQSCFECEQV